MTLPTPSPILGNNVDDDDKDDLFGEKDTNTIYGGKGDKVKQ